jgi:hypothetical protein
MMRLRWLFLLLILALPIRANAQDATPTPIQGKTVMYWDLGLKINYPADWAEPKFGAGQLVLAPPGAIAQDRSVTNVVVALRIVDPVRDFGMDKDVTFEQIAVAANIVPGFPISVPSSGIGAIAGLEAGYADIVDEQRNLKGQSLAFRMPDGRVGVLVGIGPTTLWADFAPTFDAMRASAALLRPATFPLPATYTQVSRFPRGGVAFVVPTGWMSNDLTSTARLFHDRNLADYVDGSGYVNGPQLVIVADTMALGSTLREALALKIGASVTDTFADVQVGGRPGLQHTSIDSTTGQVVTFIAFKSGDGRMMNTFRWTTPGILVEVTRPILETTLASVHFDVTPTATPR